MSLRIIPIARMAWPIQEPAVDDIIIVTVGNPVEVSAAFYVILHVLEY